MPTGIPSLPGLPGIGGLGRGVRGTLAAEPEPPSASLALHVKADVGAYSDAGTTPVADGGTVQQWNDQSGNDRHLSQATAGKRPTYRAGILNGLPVLEFDGTADCLRTAAVALNQPTHVLVAFRIVAFNASRYYWDGLAGDTRAFLCANPTHRIYAGAFLNGTTPTTGTWYVVETLFNGASSRYRLNEAAAATGNAGAAAASGLTLGSYGDGAQAFANIQVAELLLYSAALSDADVTLARDYLNGKYAIF